MMSTGLWDICLFVYQSIMKCHFSAITLGGPLTLDAAVLKLNSALFFPRKYSRFLAIKHYDVRMFLVCLQKKCS